MAAAEYQSNNMQILKEFIEKTLKKSMVQDDIWWVLFDTRVANFLGFEFLTRNEEIDGHSHEERGIFEESFSPIFTYIFYYICYQKGAQLFLENLHIFGTKFLTPNTIFIAFLSINIF